MEPISVTKKHGKWSVVHRCMACGFERRNSLSDDDDLDVAAPLLNC